MTNFFANGLLAVPGSQSSDENDADSYMNTAISVAFGTGYACDVIPGATSRIALTVSPGSVQPLATQLAALSDDSDGALTYTLADDGSVEIDVASGYSFSLLLTNAGTNVAINIHNFTNDVLTSNQGYRTNEVSTNSMLLIQSSPSGTSVSEIISNGAAMKTNSYAPVFSADSQHLTPPVLSAAVTNGTSGHRVVTLSANSAYGGPISIYWQTNESPFSPYLGPLQTRLQDRFVAVAQDRYGNESEPLNIFGEILLTAQSVSSNGFGQIIVSWNAGLDFILQESADLTHWSNAAEPIQLTGDYPFILVTNNLPRLFFRVVEGAAIQPAVPGIATGPASQTVAPGGTATFTLTPSGSGLFGYQWLFNGVPLTSVPVITTVAGTGTGNFSGDGAPATSAGLYMPKDVTVDASGNLLIADSYNNRVRKVTPSGVITTVAGGGSGGDGGAATNASLSLPLNVAVAPNQDFFVSTLNGSRIRKVAANGIISTAAGTGGFGYSGDGGQATNATFRFASGVGADVLGVFYVADEANSRIRRVGTNGIITTVAGKGANGYGGDGGAATNASLYDPIGVVVDAAGDLVIVDEGNYRIRKVAPDGRLSTIAGNGTNSYSGDGGAGTNASLSYPAGVAVDSMGNVFVADEGDNRIRRIDTNGIITTVAGNGVGGFAGDGGAATNASLNQPSGIAVDSAGNLFIADTANNRIRRVSSPGNALFLSGGATLVISNVTAANSGDYSVIITNAYGRVTSTVATLTVAIPGYNRITARPLLSGTVWFSFVGLPAAEYVLERAFELKPPVSWSPIRTNAADAGGVVLFTNAPVGATNNFWRVRRLF